MGDNNSKPEYPLHMEKTTKSHDAVGEGNGRYQAKFNYSTTNAAIHPNEDLIRALIVENRMKNEEIKMERMKMETEIRNRFREKERKLKEQAEKMKGQKKEKEITIQAIETEKKTSVDGRNPKFFSNKSFEFPETDTIPRVKETHIKDQAETIKKQNEVMENRKCIEKQLLGNLVNTEISKLKFTTVTKNPKPITQQLNDPPNYRRDREALPDIRPLKFEDNSKFKEQTSGKYKKNKNKQRNFDFKKDNGEHTPKSNTQSDGTKYSPFQSQKQVHMNPNPNQNVVVRNNQNMHQTALPATQNHCCTQPPPAYSSHSFTPTSATNSLDASPSAVNYPQQHPVYNIPPPSYSTTPQNKAKASNNKLNGDEQHENKFLKGNRKQRVDMDGAKKLRNKNRGNMKLVKKF